MQPPPPTHRQHRATSARIRRRHRPPTGIQLRIEEDLRRLPERCELFLGGIFNEGNDPGPLFEDLPYDGVMNAAADHPAVAAALKVFGGPARWRR